MDGGWPGAGVCSGRLTDAPLADSGDWLTLEGAVPPGPAGPVCSTRTKQRRGDHCGEAGDLGRTGSEELKLNTENFSRVTGATEGREIPESVGVRAQLPEEALLGPGVAERFAEVGAGGQGTQGILWRAARGCCQHQVSPTGHPARWPSPEACRTEKEEEDLGPHCKALSQTLQRPLLTRLTSPAAKGLTGPSSSRAARTAKGAPGTEWH